MTLEVDKFFEVDMGLKQFFFGDLKDSLNLDNSKLTKDVVSYCYIVDLYKYGGFDELYSENKACKCLISCV